MTKAEGALDGARLNSQTMARIATEWVLGNLAGSEPDTVTALQWLDEVEKHVRWIREDIAIYHRETGKGD